MKKQKTTLLALVIVLAFSACEQFLEVELPGQEPKLVLNALLENTDTIRVSLSKSRGVLDASENDRFEQIKNGQVFIQPENGPRIPLIFKERNSPFETISFYYLAGYDFKAGGTYKIFAESPGLASVNSQVIFPESIPIKEITYQDLGPNGSSQNQNLFEFTLKFEDPNDKNYYELDGNILGRSTTQANNFYSGGLNPRPVNPAYEKDYSWGSGLLFSDVLLRGKDSEMVFRINLPKGFEMDVEINLIHVSESYYKYHDSADLQNYNRGDILSQPVLIYNNIQNGLGNFSARNRDQQILTITVEN
jgi:hypothetical protein